MRHLAHAPGVPHQALRDVIASPRQPPLPESRPGGPRWGVSESTVKRWVDTQPSGGLPHRRRPPPHPRRGRPRAGPPGEAVPLDLTAPPGRCSRPPRPRPANSPTDSTPRSGPATPDEVRSLILDAGVPVPCLADEVISPVMARIGHGWAVGELDVYHEHRATQLCHAALSSLEARMTAANPVADDRPSPWAAGRRATTTCWRTSSSGWPCARSAGGS